MTLAPTWQAMLAPDHAAAAIEISQEAGRFAEAAGRRLGLGGEGGPDHHVTTDEMSDAVAGYSFPDELWTGIVYDLVVAAHQAVRAARDAPSPPSCRSTSGRGRQPDRRDPASRTRPDAEERVERQARAFELRKPYLVERWITRRSRPERPEARRDPRPPLPGRILSFRWANPATGGGADPHRRGAPGPRGQGELNGAGHRGGSRRRCPSPRRHQGAPGRAACSRRCSTTRRKNPRPARGPDRAPGGPGDRGGGRRARGRPRDLSAGAAGREGRSASGARGSRRAPAAEPATPIPRTSRQLVFSRRSMQSCASPPATSPSSSSADRRDHRILVPVRGGPHAELALSFADALARRHGARVTVLHVGAARASRPPFGAQAEQGAGRIPEAARRGHADGILREAPQRSGTRSSRGREKSDLVSWVPPGGRRRGRGSPTSCSGSCPRRRYRHAREAAG